ncbi:aldo/keto reductase [Nitrospirillum viridazoti]|uniref:2,5-diketo-D-gluconic acid reductase n=1 Tax=Nitrospirillum viridazoti CBAmc TaxID=1441467 RepID=A0A248JTN3_9PROT|nr:aldo/keto reductase [Nitrospirillum amazonense]ASG22092.1 2,5-diketo-D-gluconic acid reductase [Nitrospirillum amazonense CBAmc]TWB32777.1 2,5-diketo-D-gluconate reductase A [Nitrospirillum amazonense]
MLGRRTVLAGGAAAATVLAFGGARRALAAEAPAIPTVPLGGGVAMPALGFGTYGLRGDVCRHSVADAIAAGYRLIDTAKVYVNEEEVGAGIRDSGIDRKSLFVTSKIWVDDAGYESGKRAFQTTLDKLGLDYLDLYLIHRPRGDLAGAWRAMEELHKAGRIRAIGVSNFDDAQLAGLMAHATVKPAVNQVETHPFFQETTALGSLAAAGIVMEAWAPFAEGRNGLFTNPTLQAIGRAHGKTAAQVVLRWHHQRGVIAIPRSSNPAHRRENLAIFDFQLDADEMGQIAKLDLSRSQFPEWT